MAKTGLGWCGVCNKQIKVKDWNDPKEWIQHIETKEHMESCGSQFGLSADEFKICLDWARNESI